MSRLNYSRFLKSANVNKYNQTIDSNYYPKHIMYTDVPTTQLHNYTKISVGAFANYSGSQFGCNSEDANFDL